MLSMMSEGRQQFGKVVIVKLVERVPAISLSSDKLGLPKETKLM